VALSAPQTAVAEGNLHKTNHIIVVMQENHSFDNYFVERADPATAWPFAIWLRGDHVRWHRAATWTARIY